MAYLTPCKLKNMTPGDRVHRRLPAGSYKAGQSFEIVKIDKDREIVNLRAYMDRPVISIDVHLREDEEFIHRLRPGAW